MTLENLPSLEIDLSFFRHLQSLWIVRCRISKVSEKIGEIATLRELRISHTLIATVPREVNELGLLQSLDLSNNLIAEVSPLKLERLHTLNLDGNLLTEVPVIECRRLKCLNISSNLLRSLDGLATSELETIRLSNNFVQDISALLRSPCVLEIFADRNQVEAFPYQIYCSASLVALHLQNNQIASVDFYFDSAVSRLAILFLHGNQITCFPAGFFSSFPKLSSFTCRDNPADFQFVTQAPSCPTLLDCCLNWEIQSRLFPVAAIHLVKNLAPWLQFKILTLNRCEYCRSTRVNIFLCLHFPISIPIEDTDSSAAVGIANFCTVSCLQRFAFQREKF